VKFVFYRTRFAKMIDGVRQDFPDVEVVTAQTPAELEAVLPGAEIFVTTNNAYTPDVSAVVRDKGADLRWLHFTNSGIDYALENGVPMGAAITNSSSARAHSVASHAFGLLLALTRRLNESAATRARREWPRVEMNNAVVALDKKTLLLIGLGAIGQDIARKAKAFDMRVIGISRMANAPFVDEMRPRARLLDSVPEADVVVIATSYDVETHHMIDAAAIAALKPTAFIVNIARGALIDEAALIAALQAGKIAGAGLDVTEVEPPASDNALWKLPNVVLTPHSAAGGGDEDVLVEIMTDHLRLFLAGKPFPRVVAGPNLGL
jgi:D-2-hydroxyacid dehydrogenase (NADP+)